MGLMGVRTTMCLLLSLTISSAVVLAASSPKHQKCVPNVNCKLPRCRCWDDLEKPGNVKDELTPQMILLSFSYGLNNITIWPYLSLFDDVKNPNNCPGKGTFFVEYDNTLDASLVALYKKSHELALTVANDRIPQGAKSWLNSLQMSLDRIQLAGLPTSSVKGVRGPELYMGGDDEMSALRNLTMMYEASCMTVKDTEKNNLVWPYTYDYNVGTAARCDVGMSPKMNYPGIWQFPVPVMKFKGRQCSTLSACRSIIKTKDDAYDMLYETFKKHYYGSRSPMIVFVNPDWMDQKYQVDGLVQFLKAVRKEKDTWLLSMTQALDWIRYPVPMYKTVTFLPWECPSYQKK